jgi:hypothetical protein
VLVLKAIIYSWTKSGQKVAVHQSMGGSHHSQSSAFGLARLEGLVPIKFMFFRMNPQRYTAL